MRQGNAATVFFARNTSFQVQWNESIATPSGKTKRQRLATVSAAVLNNVALAIGNAIIVPDTTATVPGGLDSVLIGAQNGGSALNGYVHRFTAWSSRISDADVAVILRSGADFVVLVEGDSIPLSPATADYAGFAGRIEYAANQKWMLDNKAVSGSTVVNGADAASLSGTRATALDALRTSYASANPGKRVVTVVHCGHNDLAGNGHDAAAYTAQLATYLDARRAAGHITVVCTIPPSTSNVAFNTARATANTTIRGWTGGRVDYLCDWDLTAMGPDAAASDTTLYSDGIHPTELGTIVLADYLAGILQNAT